MMLKFLYWLVTGTLKYEWRLEWWADILEKKDCDYINNRFVPRNRYENETGYFKVL